MFFLGEPACSGELNNKDNLCEIFRQKKKWYQYASASSHTWGVPIPVLMAIIYHESSFRANAKPPRTTCLFVFPGPRPSSAYGYAQAIDSTWETYKSKRRPFAKRNNFDDAIDFVGWYCHVSYKMCRIAKNDVFKLYLAYHEGQKGFNRKSYRKKRWLINKARKVHRTAIQYNNHLKSCEKEFQRKGFCLWPF